MIERESEESIAEQRANPRCGTLRYVQVYVWRCGDDVCDCSEVKVQELHDNPLFRGASWYVDLASGPFYTDGEGRDKWAAELAEAHAMFPEARTP